MEEMHREIYKLTIILGDLNTLSETDRSSEGEKVKYGRSDYN